MIKRRTLLKLTIVLPVLAMTSKVAMANSPEVFSAGGYAINGYDAVGYFKQGGPVDGASTYMLKWMGAIWRFSTAKNMEAFEADPHGFAPKYGGYCAFAMAHGAIAKTVPEAWTIHEGELYLNFSTEVRDRWRVDIPEFVKLADKNWPAVLNG